MISDTQFIKLKEKVDGIKEDSAVNKEILQRVDKALNGNGQRGLLQEFKVVQVTQKTHLDGHEKTVASWQWKMMCVVAILAVLLPVVVEIYKILKGV